MSHCFRALPLCIAFSAALAWAALPASAKTEDGIERTKLRFQSGPKMINAERFAPIGKRGAAPIIILNGAGGLIYDAPEMRRIAQRLAHDGDEAYFIHYFDRTGTMFGLDHNMQLNFETWLGTVRDSIAWVRQQRGDQAPVGIFGYSLGAFLAVAAASDDPRVGAVVEHAGGVWNSKYARIKELPPVELIHGLEDKRVPFKKYCVPLLAIVKRRAPSWETHFYSDQGHVFDDASRAVVREQAADWFARKLTHSKAPASVRE